LKREDNSPLRDDLIRMVRRAAAVAPRTVQSAIGPSQVGTPCDRSLAYQMHGGEDSNAKFSDPIPALVGSAFHRWLEHAATVDNGVEALNGATGRWLTETPLSMTLDGYTMSGTCDLYDMGTGSVIDWKVVGQASHYKAKHEGVSLRYRVQAHLYGMGFVQAGLAVRNVAICMLPRNGPLNGMLFFVEPYDDELAKSSLRRVAQLDGQGWREVDTNPSEEACRWCPVPMKECVEGVMFR